MWVAILLSFGFYAPVVLWANVNETIGLLMIPKTLAYVWIVWMGYQNFRERLHTGVPTQERDLPLRTSAAAPLGTRIG